MIPFKPRLLECLSGYNRTALSHNPNLPGARLEAWKTLEEKNILGQ